MGKEYLPGETKMIKEFIGSLTNNEYVHKKDIIALTDLINEKHEKNRSVGAIHTQLYILSRDMGKHIILPNIRRLQIVETMTKPVQPEITVDVALRKIKELISVIEDQLLPLEERSKKLDKIEKITSI